MKNKEKNGREEKSDMKPDTLLVDAPRPHYVREDVTRQPLGRVVAACQAAGITPHVERHGDTVYLCYEKEEDEE